MIISGTPHSAKSSHISVYLLLKSPNTPHFLLCVRSFKGIAQFCFSCGVGQLQMAKIAAFAGFIFLVALFAVGHGADNFVIKGKVYCDNCGAGFPTRVSPAIGGAKVAVRCKDYAGKDTLNVEGESDADGNFKISVKGERPHELCETVALSSPMTACNKASTVNHGPVYLTHNNGIESDERITGPFAFQAAEKHPDCIAVMNEYNY